MQAPRAAEDGVVTLQDYVARIRRAATTTALFGTLEAAAMEAGLEYFAYAALRDHERYGPTAYPAPAVMTTYPDAWVARYFERGYAKIDPVLKFTTGIGVPYLWRWLPEIRSLDDAQMRVFDGARHAGLRQGMTVPLIGPHGARALLSLATGSEDADLQFRLGGLGLHAAVFHVAFVEMTGVVPAPDAIPKLTAMEREWIVHK